MIYGTKRKVNERVKKITIIINTRVKKEEKQRG